MRLSTLLSCAGLCSVVLLGSPAIGEDDAPRETPAGTAFTYQGLLKSSGAEVNEAVDIRIRLYDAAIDGNQIGSEQEILGVSVADGVFSVELDFGAQFNGNRRWVEIDVKLSSSPDPYETLAPRQEVTPSPFALFSLSTGIIPDAALTGTYTQQIDLTNASNTIAGDGGGLTNLAASSIGDGTINSILNFTNANNTFVGDGTGLENLNWSALIGVPAGFADGIDDAGGLWSENGSNIHFSGGNVGIGTPSPSAPLEVRGDSSWPLRVTGANNAGVRIESDGTASSWAIYHGSSDDSLKFRDTTTAATRMVIRGDSGNVGIGTSDPDGRLHVEGHTLTDNLTVGASSGNPTDFYLRSTYAGSDDAPALFSVNQWDVGAPRTEGLRLANRNGSGAVGLGLLGGADNVTDLPGVYLGTVGGSNQNDFRISTNEAGTMRDRVYVDGDTGNVGVGTSSPEGFSVRTEGTDNAFGLWAPAEAGVHAGTVLQGTSAALAITSDSSSGGRIYFTEAGGPIRAILNYDPSVDALTVQTTSKFSVPVLQIRGGADIVEGFDTSCGTELEPGTVVVIDPDTPGALMASSEAYDFKVAGVVSGANGVSAGMHLGQDGVLDGDTKVAMTGRVYVKCSTENGVIKPGTLLTTASLAGHAMAATDASRSNGAVIGKAMSSLDEGTGLVLVLVNLQ